MNPISVIISTYNRAKLLEETLNSIKNQNIATTEFELVVVNNNSSDNTEEIVKTFIDDSPALSIKYIFEPNQGLSFTRNRGIISAKHPILVLFDDDLIVEPDVLGKIQIHFESNKELMAAGGKIIPRMLTELPKWYGRYFWGLVGHIDYGEKVIPYPGNRYPAGAFLIFRKEIFDKYGLFDITLGRRGNLLLANEEKELFTRLRKNNETVLYLPDIKVHHAVEGNKFQIDYLKRHSKGIGISERKRIEINNESLILKFLEYIGKLGYAIGYGFLYIIKGQFSKFKMLVLFRWWVLEGYISKK